MYLIHGSGKNLRLVRRIYEERGFRVFDLPYPGVLGVLIHPGEVLPAELLSRLHVTESGIENALRSPRPKREISPGMAVLITGGEHAGRRGVVVSVGDDLATVVTEVHGVQITARVPLAHLKSISG